VTIADCSGQSCVGGGTYPCKGMTAYLTCRNTVWAVRCAYPLQCVDVADTSCIGGSGTSHNLDGVCISPPFACVGMEAVNSAYPPGCFDPQLLQKCLRRADNTPIYGPCDPSDPLVKPVVCIQPPAACHADADCCLGNFCRPITPSKPDHKICQSCGIPDAGRPCTSDADCCEGAICDLTVNHVCITRPPT
jgi:hypothetical protein